MVYSVDPVAIARTPFKEKFAIPRQPGLARAAVGEIQLLPPYDVPGALEGLEHASHVWLVFLFHKAMPNTNQAPRLRVRPPRLGGNQKIGVFATRSNHRPNPIGQSLVALEQVHSTSLMVSGIDLLDETPVLDIKPYVPYADHAPHATNTLADTPPLPISVIWAPEARSQAQTHQHRLQQPVVELIEQCLAQDPKPAYQVPTPEREYGVRFWDLNILWHYPTTQSIRVLSVCPVTEAV